MKSFEDINILIRVKLFCLKNLFLEKAFTWKKVFEKMFLKKKICFLKKKLLFERKKLFLEKILFFEKKFSPLMP